MFWSSGDAAAGGGEKDNFPRFVFFMTHSELDCEVRRGLMSHREREGGREAI